MDNDVEMTSLSQYDSDDEAALMMDSDEAAEIRTTSTRSYHHYVRKRPLFSCCTVLSSVLVIVGFFTVVARLEHEPVSAKIQNWLDRNVTLNDGIQYKILRQLTHDPTAFTEGLTYSATNDVLYESTGLSGQSSIRALDPDTGEVIEEYPLESKYFGEGLAMVETTNNNNHPLFLLYQLTYKKKIGFVWDATDLSKSPLASFPFDTKTGEGWGMTYNPLTHELLVSDGSAYLQVWSINNITQPEFVRRIKVQRLPSSENKRLEARYINELEWWRGRVLANVWFQDIILVIHPDTGMVEKEYDFSKLWPKRQREKEIKAGVLNGISVAKDPDSLYVTGKNWDRIYLIQLL